MPASASDGIAAPGATRPPLVIGCGALAVELVALTRRAGLPEVELTCLPASLHNRPERIPAAVRARIGKARADGYRQLFVAYADCGTGGLLDAVLEEQGVARLEGAHCYEVYAGRAAFGQLHDEEPGTFYLTDFLVRNFDRLVIRGLGLDRHPELLPIYFGNYRRLVYLAQSEDEALTRRAERAATELGGLAFERRFTGLGELGDGITPVLGPRDSHATLSGIRQPQVRAAFFGRAEARGPVTRGHQTAAMAHSTPHLYRDRPAMLPAAHTAARGAGGAGRAARCAATTRASA